MSEIKVDTVAEKTSANGVTVDGLSIKDSKLVTANSVITSNVTDANITYGKIQNVSATNRILGRDSANAGIIEEITPANLRTMLNVADGANVGGGKILQVVHFQRNGVTSISSGSFVTTNISLAITPSASNSKIFLLINGVFSMNVNRATVFSGVSLRRTIGGTTTNLQGDGNNDFLCNNVVGASNMQMVGNFVISDLDSPNTTSATTYELFARIETSGEAIVYNNGSMGSVITLMEVGA